MKKLSIILALLMSTSLMAGTKLENMMKKDERKNYFFASSRAYLGSSSINSSKYGSTLNYFAEAGYAPANSAWGAFEYSLYVGMGTTSVETADTDFLDEDLGITYDLEYSKKWATGLKMTFMRSVGNSETLFWTTNTSFGLAKVNLSQTLNSTTTELESDGFAYEFGMGFGVRYWVIDNLAVDAGINGQLDMLPEYDNGSDEYSSILSTGLGLGYGGYASLTFRI